MATPFSSNYEFAQYLERELGNLAEVLEWTADAGDFDDSVDEVLLEFDVEIAEITSSADLRKLRILGQAEVWRKAVGGLVTFYAFSDAGATYNRDQMLAGAKERLADATRRALQYDDGYSVEAETVVYKNDFYDDFDEDES